MDIKFPVGSKVKHRDGEKCEVLKFSFDGEKFHYTISSQEWDAAEHRVIEGIKTVEEDELELIEEVKEEDAKK